MYFFTQKMNNKLKTHQITVFSFHAITGDYQTQEQGINVNIPGLDFLSSSDGDNLINNPSMDSRLNYYRSLVAKTPGIEDTVSFSDEAVQKNSEAQKAQQTTTETAQPPSLWKRFINWLF